MLFDAFVYDRLVHHVRAGDARVFIQARRYARPFDDLYDLRFRFRKAPHERAAEFVDRFTRIVSIWLPDIFNLLFFFFF